ncbi:gliding motility-associated C-terminal domain-containing protein [Hyunsoonleella jejuensis]|uniref:Gliding motility-associated C-terminal domain-containing protein n=1 Tax=Hyunsoonleella jejuensis TaxID=419940 RepID=A0A1H9B5Y5_9FLAO|nr:T9SS type B sorting domain-containing protein [Hyunsoonleella jejuensis]SEP84442.1 gliding motility-associated C-terminal domain-containing protein [Hyunsoonleella jejuensis]
MRNNLYFFSFFLLLINFIGVAQNTFVPDDNFEQALINLGYDVAPLDNFVPTANINTVRELDVSLLNINDLTGIEDFTALEVLDCSENDLTALNISNNTNLIQLFCAFNGITALNVSFNPRLRILWCNFNKIPTLDLSNNPNLLSLICNNNLLLELNVSNNTSLNTLFCIGNQLSNIDVSSNTELQIFHCGNNDLNTLDVTNNPLLLDFNFEYNNIETIDLSFNRNLRWLYCLSNNLNALNLTNTTGLQVLSCGENQLSELNLSVNNNLEELYCQGNFIEALDVSNNSLLNILDCSNNKLCQLYVNNSNNTNMQLFDATLNGELVCVFVDDVLYSTTNWTNIDTQSRFVASRDECATVVNDFLEIDVLDDVVAPSYTLPILSFGNYFTQAFGAGVQLNAGTNITTSQTIYIYIKNSCYENQSSFNVFISDNGVFIPKFFTPNNDGKRDFWQVRDTNNIVNTISIYDRFGKLIKYLPRNSQGWDGTFNGQRLPNDSYWYEITLNNREILRGYFALKR